MRQPKARKVGRPKMPKGHAKGDVVRVRVNPDLLKRMTVAARASKQTISEWIRATVDEATQKVAQC